MAKRAGEKPNPAAGRIDRNDLGSRYLGTKPKGAHAGFRVWSFAVCCGRARCDDVGKVSQRLSECLKGFFNRLVS